MGRKAPNMLDTILAIGTANAYTDGSYETKNSEIEDLTTILQNQWVELQADLQQVKEELDKHRWIPVSERLPENPENGFVHILMLDDIDIPHGGYLEGYWANDNSPCFRNSDGNVVNKVTHWKPITLPKPKDKPDAK